MSIWLWILLILMALGLIYFIISSKHKKKSSSFQNHNAGKGLQKPSQEEINGILVTKRSYSYLTKNFPVVIPREQILYVESHYNKTVNDYIINHLEEIKGYYKRYNCNFIYLPEEFDNERLNTFIAYNAPSYKSMQEGITKDNVSSSIIDYLFQHLGATPPKNPMLVSSTRRPQPEGENMLMGFPIPDNEAMLDDFFKLHAYIIQYKGDEYFYQLGDAISLTIIATGFDEVSLYSKEPISEKTTINEDNHGSGFQNIILRGKKLVNEIFSDTLIDTEIG